MRITAWHPAARPGGVSSCVPVRSSLSVESMAKAQSAGERRAAISSFGRYRSVHGVVTRPKSRISGTAAVRIQGNQFFVHRLVAVKFLETPPPDATQVNHKDLDPSNNWVENLEWVTPSQNIRHSYATNPSRASSAGRTSKPLFGRKLDTEKWIPYDSTHDAARKLELYQGNIAACARGERRHTGGCEFKWGEPNEPALLPGEEWAELTDADLARARAPRAKAEHK